MLKLINENPEIFRNNVLRKLSNDFRLGIDTSYASFVYKIFDALSQGQSDVFTAMNELINSNSFDNLSGNSLDKFFEIFNISRLKKSNGETSFSFVFNGNFVFSIAPGALLKYNENVYTNGFKTDFENFVNISNVELLANNMMEQSFVVSDYIDIDGLKVEKSGIIYSGDLNDLQAAIDKTVKLLKTEVVVENAESDVAFLNRAKNLFQFYSSGSIEKILTIFEGLNIVDSYYYKQGLTTKIILIPVNIAEIDSLYFSAQEILDYFKNENIILEKPSYVSFNVKGVKEQVEEDVFGSLKIWIEDYIRTIYRKDHVFNRSDFEYKLVEFLRSISSNPDLVVFDTSILAIKYTIYAKSNLNYKIADGTIHKNETKTFTNSIYNCDNVS
jgi:hypothetical protein